MNFSENKSITSLLSHRIFTIYLVFASVLVLLQIFLLENYHFDIFFVLLSFLLTTLGLWFILRFSTSRYLTKPLLHLMAQMKLVNVTHPLPTLQLDLGSEPAQELIDLRNAVGELIDKTLDIKREAADAVHLAKVRFLAAASHDLRQPIHAFNLYLASFDGLKLSGPIQTSVDNLNKCVKAMNDMLDTLLDISNIDAGATQVHPSIFPIASPMDRIQAEFQAMAQSKGVSLRIARCSAFVDSDEEIVERILRHLVSNAVRYTHSGKILIGCRRLNNLLRVVVYDTGLGIAQERQQAIFEEYVQLNNDERNNTKGLGLGLTTVRRLAKLLDTSIMLKSQPNKGSSFAFDLPLISLDNIQPTKYASLTGSYKNFETIQSSDTTVVVIDDEPLILDATRSILQGWGYTIITASSGQEGLEALLKKQKEPDLILCDYLLKDAEKGVEVIAMLRAFFKKEIPSFLVTGITSPGHIATLNSSGLPYMFKPIDYENLRKILTEMLPLNHVK